MSNVRTSLNVWCPSLVSIPNRDYITHWLGILNWWALEGIEPSSPALKDNP